MLHVSDYRSLI